MHQKRQTTTTKLPIQRKGMKFVVRALSHPRESVPVVIAVRDMLKFATTTKEVKKMINSGLLKINGKLVKDHRESIRLFNIFEAGKTYKLTLLPTHRFTLEEIKPTKERLCKVKSRKLLKGNKIQVNLHDGSNVLTKDKINVCDSIYLDFSGKITKHIPMEKGKDGFVISGKYTGTSGKVQSVEDKKVKIKFKDKEAVLASRQIVVQ